MNTLLDIKNKLSTLVNQALGQDIVLPSDISYPPNSKMGDLSLPLLKIGPNFKKTP